MLRLKEKIYFSVIKSVFGMDIDYELHLNIVFQKMNVFFIFCNILKRRNKSNVRNNNLSMIKKFGLLNELCEEFITHT